MKTTFRTNEISHIWMHKSAPYGKCPGNANFDGDAFRSYGTVIARHCEHKGKPYIVHDATTFSSSTGKTQSHLRHAFDSSVPVFRFDAGQMGQRLDPAPEQLFDFAVKESAKWEGQAERSRKDTARAFRMELAREWLDRAAAINSFFSLRKKVDAKTVERVRIAAAAAAEKKVEKERAAARIVQEQRQEARRAEQALNYQVWKSGAGSPPFDSHLFPVAFRVESIQHVDETGPVSSELVSTLGARVPLDSARVALRFILRHRESGWERGYRNACPVGSYNLDLINSHGVIAGCHRFGWDEIDRVAALLNEKAEVAA